MFSARMLRCHSAIYIFCSMRVARNKIGPVLQGATARPYFVFTDKGSRFRSFSQREMHDHFAHFLTSWRESIGKNGAAYWWYYDKIVG